jgi:prohibitin 2
MSATTTEKPSHGVRYGSRLLAILIGTALVCGLSILLFWQSVFVRIPPGHVGVLYSLLFRGTVTRSVYPEGLAIKLPWDQIYIFETRVQAMQFKVDGLSAEGMTVIIDATTLYRLDKTKAPKMLTEVGPDYADRIVKATSITGVRQMVARYNSHELYTIEAARLQRELMEYLRSSPQSDLIFYQDVLIRDVKLSEQMTSAIQFKLTEEQKAAAYEFRLATERMEAERQRIQAIGLRNFYSIVQSSLTDKLLTWRGIEATVQIAKSPNTKIVIVGGNKDQLPLILGSDIARAPSSTQETVTETTGDVMPLPDWDKEPSLFGSPLEAIYPRPPTAPPNSVHTKPLKSLLNPNKPLTGGSGPFQSFGLPSGVIDDKQPEPK